MTAYKLVSALCKIWGFQGKIEKHIHLSQHKLLIEFHRKVFCWLDEWIELTIEDIRRMEAETKKALEGCVCCTCCLWHHCVNQGS